MDKRFYLRKSESKDFSVYKIDDKLNAYNFVKDLGVLVPEIYSGPCSLKKLVFPDNKNFVIKPVYSTNSNGVDFYRSYQGEFYRRDNELAVTKDDILESALEQSKRFKIKDIWILEELVLPGVDNLYRPDDYKVYAFQGKVGLILQKRTNLGKVSYKWYDENWNSVDVGKYTRFIDSNLRPPTNANVLIENALKLSKSIYKPFMRIDFLASPDNVYFGEFTPHPGSYDRFNNEYDIYLGRLWEQAEAIIEKKLEKFF